MRYLITIVIAALSLNAVGQTNPNYNPDYDANGVIGVDDLLGILSTFGDTWDSGDVILGCTYPESLEYNPMANIDDGSCTFPIDCAGVLNGTSLEDECGVCDNNNSNDCVQDCNGEWGGSAQMDECGVCDEDPLNDCCGGVSVYEGYEYSTVQIGEQCWFAENTRYLPILYPFNVGSELDGWEAVPMAYVPGYFNNYSQNEFDNDNDVIVVEPDSTFLAQTQYHTLGVLYNYHAVEQWQLCPNNWRVSNYDDWELLIDYLGGSELAALALKDTLFYPSSSEDFNGSNSSGFSALATGHRNVGGNGFLSITSYALWWTGQSEESTSLYLANRILREDILHSNYGGAYNGMSVRCIKD